jgi:hypothetical protein|tara:strand:+ start:1413 stop:2081 length:669 start_codon:yes stop_codon:yes gene_type:complete
MSFTLTTLESAIKEYLDSAETTFTNNLSNFIKSTEERILKSVDLPVFRKNVTGTSTSGTPYLGSPTDFLSPFSLAVISSSTYSYLWFKHVTFIRDYTPAEATTGLPVYYAVFDDDTFILAPTPDDTYTFELHYKYRPASLTAGASDGTTWLSTNAMNAMLYGSLMEGGTFLKMAPPELQLFEQRFQEAMANLKQMAETVNDEYRYDLRSRSAMLEPAANAPV